MGIIRGHRRQAESTLHEIVVTYPTITEYTDVGMSLPITKPGTPSITYTLSASHMPTVEGLTNYTLGGAVICGGRNTDFSLARTVYYEVWVNNSQIKTGSRSIASLNYWTLTAGYPGAEIGDVIDVYLWSSAEYTNMLSYHACTTQIVDAYIFDEGKETNIMRDVLGNDGALFVWPVLAGGNPQPGSSYQARLRKFNPADNMFDRPYLDDRLVGGIMQNTMTEGVFMPELGQSVYGSLLAHTSACPYYVRNVALHKLRYLRSVKE